MGQIRKLPPQHQRRRPGLESKMMPKPKSEGHKHHGTGKLQGKSPSSRAAIAELVEPSRSRLRGKEPMSRSFI
jgi:hypothetical protein